MEARAKVGLVARSDLQSISKNSEQLSCHFANMLSRHSSHRDQYGIPKVSRCTRLAGKDATLQKRDEVEKWNGTREKLLILTDRIRVLLQQIDFAERWLMPHLRPSKETSLTVLANKYIDDTCDRPVSEEIEALTEALQSVHQRWQELVEITSVVMTYITSAVRGNLSIASAKDLGCRPCTLVRLWVDKSHTPYSAELGFRCAGWKSCDHSGSLQNLEDKKILTKESLQNHCENGRDPSVWISLSNDASWVLWYATTRRFWKAKGCRVAIISADKLDRCNVPWDRSDTLVERTGGNVYCRAYPYGVKFAWPKHFLAYGWIPAQCILATFTFEHFHQLCNDRNIEAEVHHVSVPICPVLY